MKKILTAETNKHILFSRIRLKHCFCNVTILPDTGCNCLKKRSLYIEILGNGLKGSLFCLFHYEGQLKLLFKQHFDSSFNIIALQGVESHQCLLSLQRHGHLIHSRKSVIVTAQSNIINRN